MIGRRAIALIVLAGPVLGGGLAPVVRADPPVTSSVKEAGKHFQRGVTLYNEAAYRAALVEFRRAYEIAPNATVLYNIGQTYYQLQDYAAALSALDRYLTESGETAPHRSEVEQTIETLQARVGKVAVTTNVADCEVTIDDELVGKTPFSEPILVSIGRRKVTAMRAGRPSETRFVDVAAGDTVKLTLALGDPIATTPLPPRSTGATPEGNGLVTAGWVTTGVLGAGAITAGALAFLASRGLKDARDTFPVSHDDLTSKAARVSRLSAIADIAAIAAVVTGGLTLTVTLVRSRGHEVHVAVAPNGIQLAGTFK